MASFIIWGGYLPCPLEQNPSFPRRGFSRQACSAARNLQCRAQAKVVCEQIFVCLVKSADIQSPSDKQNLPGLCYLCGAW